MSFCVHAWQLQHAKIASHELFNMLSFSSTWIFCVTAF
jgi:hypothetical protein